MPAGEIGVVIAQVGPPLPIGAKSAVYKKEGLKDSRPVACLGGLGAMPRLYRRAVLTVRM
jgi:hypothetical protein